MKITDFFSKRPAAPAAPPPPLIDRFDTHDDVTLDVITPAPPPPAAPSAPAPKLIGRRAMNPHSRSLPDALFYRSASIDGNCFSCRTPSSGALFARALVGRCSSLRAIWETAPRAFNPTYKGISSVKYDRDGILLACAGPDGVLSIVFVDEVNAAVAVRASCCF